MPRYQVEINGVNFLVEMGGRVSKYGFYTMRFVEAADPSSAELAAVQMIRETQSLRDLVKNAADDPPIMNVIEIAALPSSDEIEVQEPGFAWYDENPKPWWQFWKR